MSNFFNMDNGFFRTLGKLADLMIVDKDPLKTDPMDLCNIQVLETIKEGFSLYQKERA